MKEEPTRCPDCLGTDLKVTVIEEKDYTSVEIICTFCGKHWSFIREETN